MKIIKKITARGLIAAALMAGAITTGLLATPETASACAWTKDHRYHCPGEPPAAAPAKVTDGSASPLAWLLSLLGALL